MIAYMNMVLIGVLDNVLGSLQILKLKDINRLKKKKARKLLHQSFSRPISFLSSEVITIFHLVYNFQTFFLFIKSNYVLHL